MPPFPLNLTELLGHWGAYAVFLLIGFGFGFVLEMSGFGNSRKLAAQFYFKDLTVLKVMFGAIVVAMVLIFGASALGLLDYNLLWVNPTYLWPGIVGGLIMGFGFIIGGFCPGTSLVAAATAKLDGIFFTLGVFFGIFLFGETVGLFEDFWYSSYMGRFTLPQLFNLPTGVVVVGVTLMALFMFWGAEQLERIFGDKDPAAAPRWRYAAAAGVAALAVGVLLIGQPTAADRWQGIAESREAQLAERKVQIHPGEMIDLMSNPQVKVVMLDVRSEGDYNLFHILDARHVPLSEISAPETAAELLLEPSNTVYVVMSNGEEAATEAWKELISRSVPNVYILEGGINNWLTLFGDETLLAQQNGNANDDELMYVFNSALGARYPAAKPPLHEEQAWEYTPKVELKMKRGPASGGCG